MIRGVVIRDTLIAVALWAAAAIILVPLGWLIADVLLNGAAALSWDFLVQSPLDAGRAGGIAPLIVSTLALLGVTMFSALPIALLSAISLSEGQRNSSKFAALIRACLDVLASVPSIVFGLFGNAFFGITLGLGYSILSGGLTLACMVLPILIRTIEEALRAIPDEQTFAAAALGLDRWARLRHVLLPAAAPGIAIGCVLGIGRALAETAALLFTAGYVTRMPESLMDSGRSLSVHIYDMAMNVPGGTERAYATAVVLITLLFAINGLIAYLAGWQRRLA